MTLIVPEDVARRIIEIYEDDFATSLGTVQAKWADTENVILKDFVTRDISATPELVETQWQFPSLRVGIGNMPQAGEGPQIQQFHNFYDLNVQIAHYLKHPDQRTLALIVMRHEEAVLDLLNQHPSLDFAGNENRIVNGSLALLPSTTLGTPKSLIKGLMVRFDFRLLHYGF